MSKKTFAEFNAIPSYRFDSFVFAVDKETFKQIRGKEPDKYDNQDQTFTLKLTDTKNL